MHGYTQRVWKEVEIYLECLQEKTLTRVGGLTLPRVFSMEIVI